MTKASPSRSDLIDARIAELADWRGETLARVRALIKEADPDVIETWKWRGVPVWEHAGIICTGETYKSLVKLTFAKGASLEDPPVLHTPGFVDFSLRHYQAMAPVHRWLLGLVES